MQKIHFSSFDPKRRKALRERFKMNVRKVIYNRMWILEIRMQKISLNVKENITLMMRQQNDVGILTLEDIAIIRKPSIARTVWERKTLLSLISKLSCLKAFPPKLRARLLPHLTFLYIGPGRYIIKEGRTPVYMYFILLGKVEVSKRVFNEVTKQYEKKVKLIMSSGDTFGDVELLENCTRKYSYTSASKVELLAIEDDVFKDILQSYLTKKWIEKKSAVLELGYFDFFDEKQISIAHKMGALKEFNPLETIYEKDKGLLNNVYFVLSGECQIMQCLQIKEHTTQFKKTYELTEPNLTGSHYSLDRSISRQGNLQYSFDLDAVGDSDIHILSEAARRRQKRLLAFKKIEKRCGVRIRSDSSSSSSLSRDSDNELSFNDNSSLLEYSVGDHISQTTSTTNSSKYSEESNANFIELTTSPSPAAYKAKSIKSLKSAKSAKSTKSIKTIKSFALNSNKSIKSAVSSANSRGSKEYIQNRVIYNESDSSIPLLKKSSVPKKTVKLVNHFIEVGTLSFGAIFGLGEELIHRVIIANTKVQCFILPRYWLLQEEQNPGRIWQRRLCYLDRTIPSRQTLFKNFIKTRKWLELKKKLIDECIDLSTFKVQCKKEELPIIDLIIETTE